MLLSRLCSQGAEVGVALRAFPTSFR
eukprot:SAG11_NODE_10821_length_803_cov_1.617898_2_plen_25_part_01